MGFSRNSLLPDWVLRPGLGLQRVRCVRVGKALAQDPALYLAGRGYVDVQVEPEACLIREVRLPANARRRAQQMAELELKQTLPLNGRDLSWRLSPAKRSGNDLTIRAFILKVSQLEAIESKIGPRLANIGIAGHPEVPYFFENRASHLRGSGVWAAVACILPAAVLLPFIFELQTELEALDMQLAMEAKALDDTREMVLQRVALLAAREAEPDAAPRDLALLEAERSRLWLLAELTRALDDDVWLDEIVITGRDLRLTGYVRSDVIPLMETLQQIPWVVLAQVEGSIFQDSVVGATRFNVVIRLAATQSEL